MRCSFVAAVCLAALGSGARAQDLGEVDMGIAHDVLLFHAIQAEAGYADAHGGTGNWHLDGWIGGDTERVWLRSEGHIADGETEEAEAHLYYGWNFDPYWDALLGVRQDFAPTGRTYLAAGIVGLARYFFETEATAFLSTGGDVSARFTQSLDILLTQRLIAEPHIAVNLFAQDVPDRLAAAGISDVEAGLQVRYEIRREFAPYVEFVWIRKLGGSSGLARAAGEDPENAMLRVGLRFWI